MSSHKDEINLVEESMAPETRPGKGVGYYSI